MNVAMASASEFAILPGPSATSSSVAFCMAADSSARRVARAASLSINSSTSAHTRQLTPGHPAYRSYWLPLVTFRVWIFGINSAADRAGASAASSLSALLYALSAFDRALA